jgi:hypothetical protein
LYGKKWLKQIKDLPTKINRGGGEEKEAGDGQREEMAQTMHGHTNK